MLVLRSGPDQHMRLEPRHLFMESKHVGLVGGHHANRAAVLNTCMPSCHLVLTLGFGLVDFFFKDFHPVR